MENINNISLCICVFVFNSLFTLHHNSEIRMLVIKEAEELKSIIAKEKSDEKVIGFVPTMGALHEGHLSLVEKAGQETDYVVVSIFVNPTQFNDKDDLRNYPRDIPRDLELLEATNCQLVFAPEVETMYPEPDIRQFNFGQLEQVMEGKFRPGHFNGVAQVVSRLFYMVDPDKAFFGQKDFQQLVIIRSMTRQLNLSVEIISCPIIREADGLAKSSRNARLTDEQRAHAPHIFHTLNAAIGKTEEMSVAEIKQWVVNEIDKDPFLRTEYFEIIDDETLQSVCCWNSSVKKIGCIAVFCGKIRLIDNIVF